MKRWWCLKFHKEHHTKYRDRFMGTFLTMVSCSVCRIDWIKENHI